MNYKQLEVVDSSFLRKIYFNRPEVHNAFNEELISELTHIAKKTNEDDIRLVILRGKGKSFSAGADLNWMKKMKGYSLEENFQDSLKLAQMFESLNEIRVPVISVTKGYTLGGGTGILAVSDYVLSESNSKFAFSEVKLGLIPSVISPYLLRKIGESYARAYFLSGERFDVNIALKMNLIHKTASEADIEQELKKLVENFLETGPQAAIESKKLIKEVSGLLNNKSEEEIKDYTSKLISHIRIQDEAQRGMSAILNKEKVNWLQS